MKNWHTRNISDLSLESGTDINYGRNTLGVEHKRKRNNKIFLLPSTDSITIVKRMSSDASIILLVIAYLIASLLGRASNSLPGILLVLLSFAFSLHIKYRSSLRVTNAYRMLLPEAKIIENGINKRLSVYDVEVNDLITFSQGDIITADARLVTSSELVIAERVINEVTGRSEFQKYPKDHNYLSEEQETHCKNMVYAGSMVVSGKGSAIVTAIGADTEICKTHSGISVVSENDNPAFLNTFYRNCRKFSLLVMSAVVPVMFLAVYLHSRSGDFGVDLLSMFILVLALSSTTMSELTISSADSIITKELLPSSVVSKSENMQVSRITKLSAAEDLANIDSVLVLCPECLLDQEQLVRKVYFSGKQYRADALLSEQVFAFAERIAPYFAYMPTTTVKSNDTIVSDYLSNFANICIDKSKKIKFLRNYPVKGARSCVLDFDSEGKPNKYITCTQDISLLHYCDTFRIEGGGEWKLTHEDVKEITDYFSSQSSSALINPIAFFSANGSNSKLIFEGIICIGEELLYSDGESLENLTEAGVHPIIVLEEENKRNLEIAYNCGFSHSNNDIAIFSEFQKAGLSVSDAHLSTKVYIGFGRKGTQAIAKRLASNSRNALPIIKDSANRHDVIPYNNIYATQSHTSLDSVRIASSVALMPNKAKAKCGGLSDALKIIQSSSMAFLKLGIYKNYLVFSALLRVFTVCLLLIFGFPIDIISPIALLSCGFFCDYFALFSIAYFRGSPVKAKNTIFETRKLFNISTSFISAFCSLILSALIPVLAMYLIKTDAILPVDASVFVTFSLLAVHIASIGGFLLILRGRTRMHKFNFFYSLLTIIILIFIISIPFFPKFAIFLKIGVSNAAIIPYIFILAATSVATVVFLIGNLSSYWVSKHL